MKLKNLINTGKAVLLANLFGKSTPINVKFKITSRCNSNCTYCLTEKNRKELTTDEVLDLIDQMAKEGTQRIGFFGGEALLREDLGKIIDFCNEKSLYTTIQTNGYLVPQRIDVIKKLNCLILSFDGPRKAHDANRGKGTYDKVMKAIKISVNYVPVITHTTITKQNIGHIDYILEIAKKYGISATFCPIFFNNSLLPSNSELKQAIKKLMIMKKNGYPVLVSNQVLKYWLHWKEFSVPYANKKRKEDPECWAGKLYCEIESDGTIAGCDWKSKSSRVNVQDHGFKEAFQSLGNHKCKACLRPWTLEYNFMYSLNLGVIWNWLKFIKNT